MGQDNSSIQRKPGLISEICNETLCTNIFGIITLHDLLIQVNT